MPPPERASAPPRRSTISRSSTGTDEGKSCLVCRYRKVKCDKDPNGCENCRHLEVPCPGLVDPQTEHSATEVAETVNRIFESAGVNRRRYGSCRECRISKARCSKQKPQCSRCRQRSLPCSYADRYRGEGIPGASGDHGGGQTPTIERQADEVPTYTPLGTESIDHAAATPVESPWEWLFSSSLPGGPNLKAVVECYFEHIHPLRCIGFIHKPSFLQALDQGLVLEQYSDAVVYTMCALGARFLQDSATDTAGTRIPGERWGVRAKELVVASSCLPSIKNLMALLLFCEYGIRTGQNATVFMLVGCCHRMSRLLRLDSEAPNDENGLSPTLSESRRRMMWSCYLLDALVGAGVDDNLAWITSAPEIKLPCSETDFLRQNPGESASLDVDQGQTGATTTNICLRAHIVRLMYLRSQTLRCIRQPHTSSPIWSGESQFMRLLNQLESWYHGLPDHLAFTDLNLYIHKDEGSLAAFFFIHITYHSCVADLTRITLPGYTFPASAAFQHAPDNVKVQHQNTCFLHADRVSHLLKRGMEMKGPALDDYFASTAAFESTKIQVIYVATLCRNASELLHTVTRNVRVNLDILVSQHWTSDGPNFFLSAICPFLSQFGFHDIASRWARFGTQILHPPFQIHSDSSLEKGSVVEVAGPKNINYLNQIATFRLARSEVHGADSRPAPVDALCSNEILPTQRNSRSALIAETSMPTMDATWIESPDSMSTGLQTNADLGEASIMPLAREEYLTMAAEIGDYMNWDGSYFSTDLNIDDDLSLG